MDEAVAGRIATTRTVGATPAGLLQWMRQEFMPPPRSPRQHGAQHLLALAVGFFLATMLSETWSGLIATAVLVVLAFLLGSQQDGGVRS